MCLESCHTGHTCSPLKDMVVVLMMSAEAPHLEFNDLFGKVFEGLLL